MFYLLSGAKYIQTAKGGTMLLYDGYKYSRNYQKGVRVSWKCNKSRCIARISSVGNQIIAFKNLHNHGKGSHIRWTQNRPM